MLFIIILTMNYYPLTILSWNNYWYLPSDGFLFLFSFNMYYVEFFCKKTAFLLPHLYISLIFFYQHRFMDNIPFVWMTEWERERHWETESKRVLLSIGSIPNTLDCQSWVEVRKQKPCLLQGSRLQVTALRSIGFQNLLFWKLEYEPETGTHKQAF